MHTIEKFGCVLSWDSTNPRVPVRVLHPSFTEYMTDKARCGNEKWFIDIPQHRFRLGTRCLDVIQSKGFQDWLLCPPFEGHANVYLADYIQYVCSSTDGPGTRERTALRQRTAEVLSSVPSPVAYQDDVDAFFTLNRFCNAVSCLNVSCAQFFVLILPFCVTADHVCRIHKSLRRLWRS